MNVRAREKLIVAIAQTDSTFRLDGEHGWVGKCVHCRKKIAVSPTGTTIGSIEHIVPSSSGGTESLMNLAIACVSCNNEKGARVDQRYPDDPRAVEVVEALLGERRRRWREPEDGR